MLMEISVRQFLLQHLQGLIKLSLFARFFRRFIDELHTLLFLFRHEIELGSVSCLRSS